jgi:hypothetical protein
MTAAVHELADGDGDSYIGVGTGEAELYANGAYPIVADGVEPGDGNRLYGVRDVGAVRYLAGRAATGVFDPHLHTDRVMPVHLRSPAQIGRAAVLDFLSSFN